MYMVLPFSVNVQIPERKPLVAEAELLHHTHRACVSGHDVGLIFYRTEKFVPVLAPPI